MSDLSTSPSSATRAAVDLDRTDAYDFELPEERIAVHPAERRSDARLLVVEPGVRRDTTVASLTELLEPCDLLVVNDARVSPVRIAAARPSGGAVEVFVLGFGAEGVWTDPSAGVVALTRSNRSPKAGEVLSVDGRPAFEFCERQEDGTVSLRPLVDDVWALLDGDGAMPLPPYITRRREALGEAAEQAADHERYQTVFARQPGAVAAPTAGLHFDAPLLDALRARGVRFARVTLWVGVGTFAPVRAKTLDGHELHREHYEVPDATAQAVNAARAGGHRVVAVGTTVVRTLESSWTGDGLAAGPGSTRLFVRPGYRFRAVDALMTNFHLPRSTLLALVCAFGGYRPVMDAYDHAVRSGYRFYSYGDAMFLPRPALDERHPHD